MSSNHSYSTRCAACKCLRRKCGASCILAPCFPSSNPPRFASVHKIFGAANMTKMLEQVPQHLRGQAADCMIFEAVMRMRDPLYGSVGIISQLQQQITQVENEIMKIQGDAKQPSCCIRSSLVIRAIMGLMLDLELELNLSLIPREMPVQIMASLMSWILDELYAKFNQQS